MATVCKVCGEKQGFMAALGADLATGSYTCEPCLFKQAEAAKQRHEKIKAASQNVVLTSTPQIDGYRVRKYLGIESVEFVIGTGVFSEVSTSISDFFGARSSAFEKKLRAAKEHAMNALKYVAAEKGANAVVSVDLDYTEFSGNRIALIINGTLVAAEPIEKAPKP